MALPIARQPNKDVILRHWTAPRDGHTARQPHQVNDYTEPMTLRYQPKRVKINNKENFVYTTALDDLGIASYGGMFGPHEIILNKNRLWETVVDTLEKNCLKKQEIRERNIFPDCRVIEYTLPITGEYLEKFSPQDIGKHTGRGVAYNAKEKFVWRGQTFFHDKIYAPSGNSSHKFELYGRVSYKEVPTGAKRLKGKIRVRNTDCQEGEDFTVTQITGNKYSDYCYDRPLDTSRCCYVPFTGSVDYITIDLGKDTKITHISTMGRYNHVYKFPPYDYSMRKIPVEDFPKHQSFMYVKNTEKHFVTKYAVSFRTHSDRTWYSVGEFQGNSDRLTEYVHTLSDPITARYVKIVPLSWSNSPSMQVCLFGPVDSDEKETDENSTITCNLVIPTRKKYLPDGLIWKDYRQRKIIRTDIRTNLDKAKDDYNNVWERSEYCHDGGEGQDDWDPAIWPSEISDSNCSDDEQEFDLITWLHSWLYVKKLVVDPDTLDEEWPKLPSKSSDHKSCSSENDKVKLD